MRKNSGIILLVMFWCLISFLKQNNILYPKNSNFPSFRRIKESDILLSVNNYKESLRENPGNLTLLNTLLAKLNSSDSKEALSAALVLVEQGLISEEQRLKAVCVIKDNYDKFLKKPLRYQGMVDLHIHSLWSDAVGTPAEMAVYAWLEGMKAVAAVDHDSFNGVYERMKAGEILGVKVIPAIEIDAIDESRGIRHMHIMAYFDKGTAEEFKAWLEEIKDDTLKQRIDGLYEKWEREGRFMFKKFNEKKFVAEDGSGEILVLNDTDIAGRVGRLINPYRLGDVLFLKYGAQKLGVADPVEAAEKYFTRELGTYILLEPRGLPLDEVVKFVVSQGGALVVPHPTELTEKYGVEVLRGLLRDYAVIEVGGRKFLGIRGVEVYSYKTPLDERDIYLGMIGELNRDNPIYSQYPLITTVGSDGHHHFEDFSGARIPGIQEPGGTCLDDLLLQLRITSNIANGSIGI